MAEGRFVWVGDHDHHFSTIKDLEVFVDEEFQRLAAIERTIGEQSERDVDLWEMIAIKAKLLTVLLTRLDDWIRTEEQELDDEIAKVREQIRRF